MRQSAAAALKQKQSYSARQFFFYFKKIPFFSDLSSIAWFRLGKVLEKLYIYQVAPPEEPKEEEELLIFKPPHIACWSLKKQSSCLAIIFFKVEIKCLTQNISKNVSLNKMSHSKCLKECLI